MNSRISSREHARFARELIDACGGLEEASRNCRIRSKSTLSEYQNPHLTPTMPADVMADLELYCGKPIYSGTLFDRFDASHATGNLRDLACDLAEQSVVLQGVVRTAIADDRLTPRELDEIAAAERDAEAALDKLKGARRAAEIARPNLKAV